MITDTTDFFSLHHHDPVELQMESNQQIQVYLPPNYEEVDKKYPVLYILDAQWFYTNGVAIQQTLRGEQLLPEMIVVGVDLKNRHHRDSILINKWEEFGTYVKDELVDFIDQSYRTNSENILFGWENNAFLASELIISDVSPFDGVIASNGGSLDEKMIQINTVDSF